MKESSIYGKEFLKGFETPLLFFSSHLQENREICSTRGIYNFQNVDGLLLVSETKEQYKTNWYFGFGTILCFTRT